MSGDDHNNTTETRPARCNCSASSGFKAQGMDPARCRVHGDTPETHWAMAELDILHSAVGLGHEWQASERRAEMLTHGEGTR